MTTPPEDRSPEAPSPDHRPEDKPLEEIQDEIIEALHAGDPLDRAAILAAHPGHGEELERFFGLVDVLEEPPNRGPAELTRLGEFTIVRELGRGGMGVVYEAEQASLRRRVALKILPPALGRDEQLVARFQREAEAAGRLRHPNIVPVFSVGEAAGTPFFAMELVGGETLAQVIAAKREGAAEDLPAAGPDWAPWCVETVAKIADALAYAHGEGVLHRDIKPANIIVDTDGAPRLTDFGLALDLRAGGLTLSGETFGTPQYMSPEQLLQQAKLVDARTDVYSLAVTLYELLTLRLPYEADSAAELFMALRAGQVRRPRKLMPDMDPALERVLLRALRVDPTERYETAADFATDLRAVLRHEPIARAPRRRKRSRRQRLVGGLVGAATVALLAFLIFGSQGGADGPPTAPHVPTRADWVRLAEGAYPDGEAVLRRWTKLTTTLRRYQRRTKLDMQHTAVVEVPRLPDVDQAEAGPRVILIARWDIRVGDGRWRAPGLSRDYAWGDLTRSKASTWGPSGVQGWFSELTMFTRLTAEDDIVVHHRARIRVLLQPSGWGRGERPQDFWTDQTGVATTLTLETPVTLVKAYPPDYPKAVADPAVGKQLEQLLASGAQANFVPQGVGRALARVKVADQVRTVPATPVAAHVEFWTPDGATKLATASLLWTERHRPTWFTTAVDQGVQEADWSALDSVLLRVKGAREAAAHSQYLESYWDGAFEITIPVVAKLK